MTLEELKASYTVAYKIIMRERAMRAHPSPTFSNVRQHREEYVGEMDKLLEIVDDMKDELKKRMLAEPEQATLLDVVREVTYP